MRKSTVTRCHKQLLLCIVFFILIGPSLELDCVWGTTLQLRTIDNLGFSMATTLDGCKEECETKTDCAAIFLKNGLCVFVRADQALSTISDTDAVFSKIQSCSEPCEMTTVSGLTFPSSPIYSVNTQQDTSILCGDLCKGLTDCRAFVYSSTSCTVYNSTPTSSSTAIGFVLVKMTNGCDISAQHKDTTTSDEAMITISSTADFCKNACLKVSGCAGVSEKDGVCKLYDNVVEETADNQYTYSKRSTGCSQSATLTFQSCSGAQNQPFEILVALILCLTSLIAVNYK